MEQERSTFTFRDVSLFPLFLTIPFIILAITGAWAYDEAWTYVSVIDTNPGEIVAYSKFKYANNHVLNTLYFYFLNLFEIKSVFVYRLPSIISFIVYYYFISRVLSSKEAYRLGHIEQLVLYLWPYSVYFVQGRGYGVAIACFVGVIYFFRRYMKEGSVKDLLYFVLLGCISSIALFSFCFPFVAMVIILGLSRFNEIIKSVPRILILAVYLPVLWYVFDKGSIVNEYDTNIIGAESLLKGGTVSSLISFLSLTEYMPFNIFLILKGAVLLTMVPALIVLVKRGKWYLELSVIAITLLLFVISHYVLGALYPMYRGVAYLLLLLYLPFVYTSFKRNIFVTIHLSTIVLIGVFYLGSVIYHSFDKHTKDVLFDVAKDNGVVLFEDVHRSSWAINHLHHNDTLRIVNCATEDVHCFDSTAQTAKYIICVPERLEETGISGSFSAQYKVSTFFGSEKYFYKRIAK